MKADHDRIEALVTQALELKPEERAPFESGDVDLGKLGAGDGPGRYRDRRETTRDMVRGGVGKTGVYQRSPAGAGSESRPHGLK